MSWIGSLAGKAETLLTLVDHAAGQALQRDPADQRTFPVQWSYQNEPFEGGDGSTISPSQNDILGLNHHITYSASVPINLNRLNEEIVPCSPNSSQKAASPGKLSAPVEHPYQAAAVAAIGKKDKDEELFEFLNTPDVSITPSNKVSGMSKNLGLSDKVGPGKAPYSVSQVGTGFPATERKPTVARDNSKTNSAVVNLRTSVDLDELQQARSETNDSGMETENQMLRQEINALKQELNSLTNRSQETQEELRGICHQLSEKSRAAKNTDELHARLADMQEALGTKDTQLAILKVRLEEVKQELESSRRSVDQLQVETQRLFNDHPSTVGSGEHSRESLEAKLVEIESQLKKEQARQRQMQGETMERLNTLEADKQRLCSEVGRIQRFYEDEKGRTMELQSQLKVAKSLADTAKQEMSDYKDKAMRILQSKERLIMTLKDGSVSSLSSNADQMVSSTELEAVRQERDMIRDELHHTRMALETAKLEITELEMQLQQDQGVLQKRIESVEEQVQIEKKRRQEVEEETASHKQEIGKLQGELQKQTTALQSRIDDRDEEIHRLRNQVTMKSLSGSSQDELESRLHTLTESLIQKQTILEALSTEKNSLVLQLERMEKHYREAEAEAIRASAALAGVQDHQEARQRLPGLLKESPMDGEIARQVKNAANVLDRFSIRLGLFLRRYPIARVFVILYMALLHFWVFVVLMTHQQEMHKSFLPPQPPNGQ